ncbi:12651_t:CDS:2, partial [Funneliformis caledonium]
GNQEQESLKRHIEKVFKEEVSELRQTTHLSNAKPSENEIQEYFMDECTALKALPEIQLYVRDTHSTPLLNTRKPDFVFIQKGRPLDLLNVVAVGEIRKRTVLTDCINIRIYRITREGNNQFSYRYTASESLTYNTAKPPNRWKYLVTIMQNSPDQLGWVEPSINLDENTVTLVRSISSSRTSIVYEGILENRKSSVVVKKAKREEYLSCFINEKNVLTRLLDLNSPYLLKLLLSNDDTLIMTPLCTKVNNLQIKDIENIIETLKTVHSNFQLVHIDLRKYNFLRDDDCNILITDWDNCKIQGENAPFAEALKYILDFWAVNGKSEWWDIISSDAKDLNYDKLLEDIKSVL